MLPETGETPVKTMALLAGGLGTVGDAPPLHPHATSTRAIGIRSRMPSPQHDRCQRVVPSAGAASLRHEGLAVPRRAGPIRSSNGSFGIRIVLSARHEPAEPQPDREREDPAEDDVNDRAAERALHRAQTAAS